MPATETNTLRLHTANECGRAEKIRASIGCCTPSLASRITTSIKRVSPRALPEDEIDDSDLADYNSYDNYEEPGATIHGDDDDDCGDTIESQVTMANMQDMLELQQ